MGALCWSDYLCPWCYIGTDRSALLRSLGVRVVTLPFELHPEIPIGGYERPRSASRWAVIAAECADAGLPFDPPTRSPNTRRVLEVSEWVRRTGSDAQHVAFESAVFRAHFAEQRRIDDPAELASFVAGVGLDADNALAVVTGGGPAAWVDESMAQAREAGVSGTPAWVLAGPSGPLLIPGAQPRSFFQRVARRLTPP
jgi:predicted DsbA family dithiol-disulfide isomerase